MNEISRLNQIPPAPVAPSKAENFAKSEDGKLLLLRTGNGWALIDNIGEIKQEFGHGLFAREQRGKPGSELVINQTYLSKLDEKSKEILEKYSSTGYEEVTGAEWQKLMAPGSVDKRQEISDGFINRQYNTDESIEENPSEWDQLAVDNEKPLDKALIVSQFPGYEANLKELMNSGVSYASSGVFKLALVDNLNANIRLAFEDYFTGMSENEFEDLIRNGPDEEFLNKLPASDAQTIRTLFKDYKDKLDSNPSGSKAETMNEVRIMISQNLADLFAEKDFIKIDSEKATNENYHRDLYLKSFGVEPQDLSKSGAKVFQSVLSETKKQFDIK